jgi:hypothetical protein
MALHAQHDPRDLQLRPSRHLRARDKSPYNDPFNPLLLDSPAVQLSLQQQELIQLVLDNACSDTMFAKKAYASIWYILTHGNDTIEEGGGEQVVTSISPSNVVIGAPSFDIHVHGTGFTSSSTILFNGIEEPTTFVSDSELTTGVNMPLWVVPAVVPVGVVGGTGTQDFTFTAAGMQAFGKK